MSDLAYENSLVDSIDIYRNTGEELDDYGNPTTNTADGEYPILASGVSALLMTLYGTKLSVNLNELGLGDNEGFICYLKFSQDIKKDDYIKKGNDTYLVIHVVEDIPEDHHKEVFLKKVVDS